ncbi:MAG: DUF2203 family protein [Bdellovibrionales bacterium]
MAKVIPFNVKRVFDQSEADDMIRVLSKITRDAKGLTDEMLNRLYSITEVKADSDEAKLLEQEIDAVILDWQAKVQKLGGKPKGMWLVDLDSGDGYYCWKFPEDKVLYWHRYSDGYTDRVPVGAKKTRLGLIPDITQTDASDLPSPQI